MPGEQTFHIFSILSTVQNLAVNFYIRGQNHQRHMFLLSFLANQEFSLTKNEAASTTVKQLDEIYEKARVPTTHQQKMVDEMKFVEIQFREKKHRKSKTKL